MRTSYCLFDPPRMLANMLLGQRELTAGVVFRTPYSTGSIEWRVALVVYLAISRFFQHGTLSRFKKD
jgi:hypothetical protein